MAVDPISINHRLGRGVNLGNALEAPREGDWGVVLEEDYFIEIIDRGFDSVRIPIRWSSNAAHTEPYTIDPAFFERVDWVVRNALAHGLAAVINMHHYEEIFVDPAKEEARFLSMWAQIAEHYRNYPDELVFEPLNEPHDQLDADAWNMLLVKVLAEIRKTNPERIVMFGPAGWNNVYQLEWLELPEDDRRIIVTFHYYQPFDFTHQGAEWVEGSEAWLGTTWVGTNNQKQAIEQEMAIAADWAAQHARPVYMGEFGAYSKADIDSRIQWTKFVARLAESYGFSWAYWEFAAGFGVYDRDKRAWNIPLVRALLARE